MGSSLFSLFSKFVRNFGYVGIRKQFLDLFIFLRTIVVNLKNHLDIKT